VNAGWFARDPKTLLQVGHSLLQLPYSDAKQPRRILVADDCFKLSLIPNEDTVGAVLRSVQKLLGREFATIFANFYDCYCVCFCA
jgi:amidase